ncbi:DUF645 family protein [Vibrio cholerae]|uniref:DUF645 family protein n=1 Tax=Vibrio cholerae TaxID=666 RepID=UPI000D378F1E|nr:DUF645 family protein [Vibrio cholerae]ELR8730056.1 DUF645 family protein [Vibrio vulnificus]EGQ7970924.1 DUF645 family protein [Vibrio cholerae]EGQ9892944.1 DUF645 family protein [Vibrio cholerae]EHK7543248.1 DUF645 family protein [Vibrio cholerae]EJK2417362.1 DUF645 family protein [Vibrio cholerae]
MLLDAPHGKFDLTKVCIIAESVLCLSRTLNLGQLNLYRFKFWLSTSQLLELDVCLSDALRKMHFKQMYLKSHW